MINFFIEPGYDVRKPERDFGNAGIDFFVPNYTEDFAKAFNEKNVAENASLCVNEKGENFIRIEPHGRANIPSGVRSRICVNVALEAHNKSGIATKLGLVFGIAEGLLFCVMLGYGAAMLVGYLGSFDPELFGDHVVESSLIMKTMSSVDLFGIAEGLVK